MDHDIFLRSLSAVREHGGMGGTPPRMYAAVTMDTYVMASHMRVFRQLHPEVDDWFTLVHAPDPQGTFDQRRTLVFESRKSYGIFKKWWRRYSKWFGGTALETKVPTITNGQKVNGTAVVFCDEVSRTRDYLAETWPWIFQNCHGRVWCINNIWIFKRDADAVQFRMWLQSR